MTKWAIQDREIRAEEIEVVRISLDRAATTPKYMSLLARLTELRVVGVCECGCASVEFAYFDAADPPTLIANATGRTFAGGLVGIIVWGTADRVTGREVYDLGAGQHDLTLPVHDSIEPFRTGEH